MRTKGVKVWVVWRRYSSGWVAQYTEWSKQDAEDRKAASALPGKRWAITSRTVMPPGERGR